LVSGRDFSDADLETTRSVAVINEEFTRRYFPAENPIGRQIHIGPPAFLHIPDGADILDDSDVTIVGVVGNVRNSGLALAAEPQINVLYRQHPLVNPGFKDLLVRTVADPQRMTPEIRRQLQAMDADLPLSDVHTMNEILDQQTGGERFTSLLLTIFAGLGLALSVVGIYGVMSYLVAQRSQEMAVRLAIGASRANILWLVLREGFHMALAGAALGLLGAFAARRLMSGLLFGISALDPVTFAGAALLLIAVAGMASVIPGTRAMRVELTQALRQE
jgi:hypothetical protein